MAMLRRSGSKAAVFVAAALSLTSSVGLHPEPAVGVSPGCDVAVSAPDRTGRIDAAVHVCLVCLLHAVATGPVVAAVASSSAPPEPSCVLLEHVPGSWSASRTADGRAPPVLL
jgi:hypothetical protein